MLDEAIRCKHCRKDLVPSVVSASTSASPNKKRITETKVTCLACGHIWFYGKAEEDQNASNQMSNCAKNCSCSMFAFIPDEKIIDFDKCQKCNSQAVKKERVTYEI